MEPLNFKKFYVLGIPVFSSIVSYGLVFLRKRIETAGEEEDNKQS